MSPPIRVLVVRDPTGDGDTASSVLQRDATGFAVTTVGTVDEARASLTADLDTVDCVVCDRSVSEADRFDVLELAGEQWPAVPVVFVTDEDDPALVNEAIAAGATDCLRWQSDTNVSALLARRIRNAVSGTPPSDERRLSPAECTAVFDHVHCGVMLVDVTGGDIRYSRCNERMSELAELPVDEIEGRTPSEAFGAELGREIESKYRECLERDEPLEYTITVDLADKQLFREGVVRPVPSDGETNRLLVVVKGVTEQREREAELRESKRRLRALFEQSPDMILIHDRDGKLVECNPRLCEKTGYDRSTLTEMRVWDLDMGSDPDRARRLWESMAPGDRERTEGEFLCKDGSTFPVEVNIRRLGEDGRGQFMAISRDISDQQARENELRRKNERLEEFASVVSHDLRNPLQVLRGALDGAAETGEQAHFDRGHRAIDRMEDMITDILALARQGDNVDDVEVVSLRDVVDRCWENVRTDEATLVVETDQRIRASEMRLKQLVENLLRNAVEHGGADATIHIGTLQDGFYVADDGCGIPADDRDRVFESGYSTAANGTGFGLAIVEGIAEAHGWSVELSESETGGARFEFTGVTVV